jgi:hypothetical protein
MNTTAAYIPPSKPPVSYARQRPDGSWFVAVTWQSGRREQIGSYKSFSEAETFITEQLQAWHDGQRALTER